MINENGISYWSEPLVKEMKTRAYPDGTMVKEPRKAFLLFQEYLHLEYLKNKGGRSQRKLVKYLKDNVGDLSVEIVDVDLRTINRYSVKWEWVKRAEAYDNYRIQLRNELNKQILVETLNTNCRIELHNSEVLGSLSVMATKLYEKIYKKLLKIIEEDSTVDLKELQGYINLLKDVQEFFLENSNGICNIKKTDIRAGLEEAWTDELVEGSFTELLRSPDELNRILNECNDYDEIYKQELEKNKSKKKND